eukprot:TRINITY_DN688_c0_g1_i2.p1 TRINITY_DN688_c0_g1~~TRINITY_DN688_c0_g1_i2.p1  ORF type:complete len:208 (+),score=46.22 TRINITY_DN688_c0_g1_i2:68-691(+)
MEDHMATSISLHSITSFDSEVEQSIPTNINRVNDTINSIPDSSTLSDAGEEKEKDKEKSSLQHSLEVEVEVEGIELEEYSGGALGVSSPRGPMFVNRVGPEDNNNTHSNSNSNSNPNHSALQQCPQISLSFFLKGTYHLILRTTKEGSARRKEHERLSPSGLRTSLCSHNSQQCLKQNISSIKWMKWQMTPKQLKNSCVFPFLISFV